MLRLTTYAMNTTVHERRIWLRASYGSKWWDVEKDIKKQRHAEADLVISQGKPKDNPEFDETAKKQQESRVAWDTKCKCEFNEEFKQKNDIIERIKADWEELRDTYLDADWKLVWGQAKKKLGECQRKVKTIRMSEWCAVEYGYDEAWDTLTHEIAHGVVGDEFTKDGRRLKHGPEWKELHKLMGGSGEVSMKC